MFISKSLRCFAQRSPTAQRHCEDLDPLPHIDFGGELKSILPDLDQLLKPQYVRGPKPI